MPTKIYDNQKVAANEIYERLTVHQDPCVLLTAQPQVGKTGAVIELCNLLYDGEEKYAVLYFSPSDKQLYFQSKERFLEYPKAYDLLLGSNIYHDGQIYPGERGKQFQELVQFIRMIFVLGKKLLVIRDEAHIGIGGNKRKESLQKIPQFLEDICESLPGTPNVHDRVQYLLVTATPFTYDFQINGEKAKITEIYLPHGQRYAGAQHLLDSGRILPHISRTKPPNGLTLVEKKEYIKNDNDQFVARLWALIKEQFTPDRTGYFVVRCTNRKDLRLFERAFLKSNIDYEVYESATSSIPDFERQLNEKPTGPKILLIKHSYKQGKTLCLDHVVGWYENDTTNGRHDADIAQSVGRSFGYDKKDYDFPIYCDVQSIVKLIDYYDLCKMKDFASKRELPMSSTHTTWKAKMVKDRDYQVCVNKEQAEQVYRNWHPEYQGSFNTTKVSTNNAYDVIEAVKNKATRQKTSNRVNLIYIDKPNKAYVDSFMGVPHWHGRWIVLYETGNSTPQYEAKDKSYFSARGTAAK